MIIFKNIYNYTFIFKHIIIIIIIIIIFSILTTINTLHNVNEDLGGRQQQQQHCPSLGNILFFF